jgi:hypothetical protein
VRCEECFSLEELLEALFVQKNSKLLMHQQRFCLSWIKYDMLIRHGYKHLKGMHRTICIHTVSKDVGSQNLKILGNMKSIWFVKQTFEIETCLPSATRQS